ncbi:hypothetical protein ACFRAQ_05195 [Nocardia sp. NPDC056611]|uniref:hypothetical protein n=1 Tax=unclassified Nocardia TaxID=2637762 RepID=UPI00366BA74F
MKYAKTLAAVLFAALVCVGGDAALPTSVAEPAPAQPQVPAPHVNEFAQHPAAPAQRPAPPTDKAPVAESVDGCDHAYGTPGQCVPWNFPPRTHDRCAWLRDHGLTSLPLVGKRDRHNLDRNKDGTACGPGDS